MGRHTRSASTAPTEEEEGRHSVKNAESFRQERGTCGRYAEASVRPLQEKEEGEIFGGGDSPLQQAQFAGACHGFGPSLDLQFLEDFLDVPFDGIQRQEKPRADLTIRETLRNEP